MAWKEGSRHPPKRVAPAEAPDSGYAGVREEQKDARSEMERKMERLRLENRRLREAEARGRSQLSSIAFPVAPVVE